MYWSHMGINPTRHFRGPRYRSASELFVLCEKSQQIRYNRWPANRTITTTSQGHFLILAQIVKEYLGQRHQWRRLMDLKRTSAVPLTADVLSGFASAVPVAARVKLFYWSVM